MYQRYHLGIGDEMVLSRSYIPSLRRYPLEIVVRGVDSPGKKRQDEFEPEQILRCNCEEIRKLDWRVTGRL